MHELSLELREYQDSVGDHPLHLWRLTRLLGTLELLQGDFEAGEKLAEKALEIGQRIQEPYAVLDYGVQTAVIRREQGRLHELEAMTASGFEKSIADGVHAAAERSREQAKQLG